MLSPATRSWADIPFGPGPSLDVSGELPAAPAGTTRPAARRRVVRPRVKVYIRRRRVLASLAAGLLLAVALGAGGLGAAWWAAIGTAAAGVTYLLLLLFIRHLAAKREWTSHDEPASDDGSGKIGGELQSWALARFLTAWCLGWFFTPLVMVAERLVGGAGAGSRRQQWLTGCQRLRDYGRQQALKALSLTMVATAGAASLGAFAGGAAAGASPLAPKIAASSSYTTQPGNTLSEIAARYRVSVSALAAENGIRNPNVLYPGQILQVGGSGSSDPASYRVQPGDTLTIISQRFGLSVSALAADNGIANPNLIFAGQVLRIGGGSDSSEPLSYRVQPGDTLSALARRFGVSVSALAAENGIANPNLIFAGQVLRIGGAPAELTAAGSDPTMAAATSVPDAAEAVRVALAQLGRPYVYGGASPSQGFDCSGLIMYAWDAAGVSLPHYSVSQYQDTIRISEAQLQPGDLVFYNNGDGGPQPGHEALYIGNGQVVASNYPGTDVRIQPLTWAGPIIGFGRVR